MKKTVMILLLAVIIPAASAEILIANSASWENVYSAGIYAKLEGHDFKFLVSPKHTERMKDEFKQGAELIVVESSKVPYAKNYASRLERSGFTAQRISIPEESGNLDLAKRTDVNRFYIVDPTFGYDAISVAPLAIKDNAYVLFTTQENIRDIAAFLSTRQVEQITLVGELDEQVRTTLANYNPQVIREGSKYKNNIAIADKMKKETGSLQGILTNGEFLEETVFVAGDKKEPVIYIGTERPPQETMNYLRTAGFKTLVLLGNDLLGSARRIKDLMGIPIFVKFAKGQTEVGGQFFKNVQGLDMFPVPILDMLLTLKGIGYNTATRQVEFTIQNERPIRTYLQPSILIQADGEPVGSIGDEGTQVLGDNEQRGYSYDIDLTEHLGKNLTADIFIPYGYTEDELDEAIVTELPLLTISAEDDCEMDILDAAYNKDTQRFIIELKSNKECYAQASVKELMVDDKRIRAVGEVERIKGTKEVTIKQRMNEVDIADNPEITVEVSYGSRETLLVKTTQRTFEWKLVRQGLDSTIMLGGLAIIAIILILLLWKKKKRRRY